MSIATDSILQIVAAGAGAWFLWRQERAVRLAKEAVDRAAEVKRLLLVSLTLSAVKARKIANLSGSPDDLTSVELAERILGEHQDSRQ